MWFFSFVPFAPVPWYQFHISLGVFGILVTAVELWFTQQSKISDRCLISTYAFILIRPFRAAQWASDILKGTTLIRMEMFNRKIKTTTKSNFVLICSYQANGQKPHAQWLLQLQKIFSLYSSFGVCHIVLGHTAVDDCHDLVIVVASLSELLFCESHPCLDLFLFLS